MQLDMLNNTVNVLERPQKKNQKTRILEHLKANREVTNIDLNKICYRYGARINELRKDGWNIQREYWRPGIHRYWLVGDRENDEG